MLRRHDPHRLLEDVAAIVDQVDPRRIVVFDDELVIVPDRSAVRGTVIALLFVQLELGLHLRVPVSWTRADEDSGRLRLCALRACARRLRRPRTCLLRGDTAHPRDQY